MTNCEIGNDKKFDERGFNAMTKPAVWVQITVKKYRVDDKNLFHLKYPTCKKLWPFFSFCTSKDFLSKIVLSYPLTSDDFEIEEP